MGKFGRMEGDQRKNRQRTHIKKVVQKYKRKEYDPNYLALENVKFLSYEYDIVNNMRKLEKVDAILREIELDSQPKQVEEIIVEEEVENIVDFERSSTSDSDSEIKKVSQKRPKIPYTVSLMYTGDSSNILETIGTEAKRIFEQMKKNSSNSDQCSYCQSLDIVQSEQLAKAASFRMSLMSRIALERSLNN